MGRRFCDSDGEHWKWGSQRKGLGCIGPGGGSRAGLGGDRGKGCAIRKGDLCRRNQRVKEDLGRKGCVDAMESL